VPAAVTRPRVESTAALGAIYAPTMSPCGYSNRPLQPFRDEAQTLAHDVFLAFITKGKPRFMDARAWLVSAILQRQQILLYGACQTVSLSAEIVERPDPRLSRVQDFLPEQLTAREIMACLIHVASSRCIFDTSRGTPCRNCDRIAYHPKYAQKLVGKCLRRAQSATKTESDRES